jgi:signal transduction histidine kinase
MKAGTNRFQFSSLSIQQRLPLLICTLLLSAIVMFSLATYYGLKKATLTIGKERLHSLTDQLSSMLGQSSQFITAAMRTAASQNTVKQYLRSGGKDFRKESLQTLDKFHRDSTWVSMELLDSNKMPVLRSDKSTTNVKVNINAILSSTPIGAGAASVGKIYQVGDSMYYPIIASVADKDHILGYIICWQIVKATPKTIQQLSQLMGTGATFYIGNNDGSFWTNMVKPVPAPPFKIQITPEPVEYSDTDGNLMMAKVQPVANSSWLVLVQFSEQTVLEGVKRFINWIIGVGVVLTAVGMLVAWKMSRNITKPLNRLTVAASAISKGNYSSPVPIEVYRDDELGELATAFNTMTAEIYQMWQDLENKVKERTSQLEHVNSELEAFSYSISHDLRTPLRAINGYSIMLKEDYGEKLDDEGNRIIRNIITNAKMMGQLIDDLLAFSRLGKKELVRTQVDMQSLATTIADELLQHEPEGKYHIQIDLLPPAEADQVMIRQALMNLLSNAIKYSSKKDNPEIEIGYKDEIENITYYIKDNGAGFDMAYVNKLFGVFQRLHSQEEFEGTGVGLALVKRIIDKHRGEVWAEGEENIGATFYFSLPKK